MKKSIDLLRRELHAFCQLAIRRGYRIGCAGRKTHHEGVVCPIGAIGIAMRGSPDADDVYVLAARLFGRGCESIGCFYSGFDNSWTYSDPMHELGREFRSHYDGDKS